MNLADSVEYGCDKNYIHGTAGVLLKYYVPLHKLFMFFVIHHFLFLNCKTGTEDGKLFCSSSRLS